jgi:hypothetical protein
LKNGADPNMKDKHDSAPIDECDEDIVGEDTVELMKKISA